MSIFARAHLSVHESDVAELFTKAKKQQLKPYQYIQEKLPAPAMQLLWGH